MVGQPWSRGCPVIIFCFLFLKLPLSSSSSSNVGGALTPENIKVINDMNHAVKHLLDQHGLWQADHDLLMEKVQEMRCVVDSEKDESQGEFPYISITVLVTGCSCLLRLIIIEYRNYSGKTVGTNQNAARISINEFLQYRLDYYFTASQWAKPILLLSLSFILILQASIVSMMLVGDDLSTAMWKSWTYVADPGKFHYVLFYLFD